MMRLMRRSSSGTDSTSTRREMRRLLLFLLGVGLVVPIAWVVLMNAGTVWDALKQVRAGVLGMVGFGSLPLAAWIAVFVFALAFRRDWLRRYNLWVGSAILVFAGIGALSFLTLSEGLPGWFALGGEVSLGGRLGDMIIGGGSWVGGLRVIAVLAVSGVAFGSAALLSVFQGTGGASSLLSNRGGQAGSESAAAYEPL